MTTENSEVTSGNERRVSPRYRLVRAALLRCGAAESPEPCIVLDISQGGARVHVHRCVDAETMELSMDGGRFRAGCRLVWRRGDEIGLRFVEVLH